MRCLPVVAGAAFPALAANVPIDSWGFDSVWELWFIIALLIAAALGFLPAAYRRWNGVLSLPPVLLLSAAAGLFFLSFFYAGSALSAGGREPETLHVKRVVEGRVVFTDTANQGGDRWVLASYLAEGSESVFLLETHMNRVREYPRSFLLLQSVRFARAPAIFGYRRQFHRPRDPPFQCLDPGRHAENGHSL